MQIQEIPDREGWWWWKMKHGWFVYKVAFFDDADGPHIVNIVFPTECVKGEWIYIEEPELASDTKMEVCASGQDGECNHKDCPQVRDGEPEKTGRSCQLPHWSESRE